MTTAKKRASSTEVCRLSREDWLDAAFKVVVDGGFDQARVLVIAGKLGVTRGSFYWHFKDHADLIAALLARWFQREVEVDQLLRKGSLEDPLADLDRLLEAALAHGGADLENMRFELALRGLGRRDDKVAQMLVQVDQMRMALFAQKFARLTGNEKEAVDLAALFYLSIVGSHQALSRPGSPPQAKAYFKSLIARYVIGHSATAMA